MGLANAIFYFYSYVSNYLLILKPYEFGNSILLFYLKYLFEIIFWCWRLMNLANTSLPSSRCFHSIRIFLNCWNLMEEGKLFFLISYCCLLMSIEFHLFTYFDWTQKKHSSVRLKFLLCDIQFSFPGILKFCNEPILDILWL